MKLWSISLTTLALSAVLAGSLVGCNRNNGNNGGGGSSSSAPVPGSVGPNGEVCPAGQVWSYNGCVFGNNGVNNCQGGYVWNGVSCVYNTGGNICVSGYSWNGNGCVLTNGGTNGGWASTPQPCNVGAPGCNSGNFPSGWNGNNSWYYSSWQWPSQYNSGVGNCGCPWGYTPAYTANWGMVSCVPAGYMNNWNVGFWVTANWNFNGGFPQNGWGLNTNQAYYNPGAGSFGSCGINNGVAQGCDVRLNNCPSGLFCQAAGGGSVMGLCVRR